MEGGHGIAHDVEDRPVHRQVSRGPAQPGRDTVAISDHRRAAHPDERVPRPGPTLFGRFEEKGPGPIAAQCAKKADGGIAINEQPPNHRDHPTVLREYPKVHESRSDLPHRDRAHRSPSSSTVIASKQVRSPV